jgi:hypothetical protein
VPRAAAAAVAAICDASQEGQRETQERRREQLRGTHGGFLGVRSVDGGGGGAAEIARSESYSMPFRTSVKR